MKPNLAELFAHVALKMKYIIQHTDRYKEKFEFVGTVSWKGGVRYGGDSRRLLYTKCFYESPNCDI